MTTKDLKQARVLDASMFRDMIKMGVLNLKAHFEEVNDLNVFPVPDGDTGTNMRRTIETGYDVIKTEETDSISKMAQSLSKGMLLGARGNSGVILSQIFRGFSKGLGSKKFVSSYGLAVAFKAAVKQAYGAVVKPVEGTILTVLREAVKTACKNTAVPIYQFLNNLFNQAKETLPKTKEMLDVLKEADVIDSGGAGLCYIFEGFVAYFEGKEIADTGHEPISSNLDNEIEKQNAAQELDFSLFNENSELDYGYCTEFILQLLASKVDVNSFDEQEVIDYLSTIGDSIVCFKDGTIIKTHVHTKDPGAVLSYVRRWGEFLTIKVENMALQHNNKLAKEEAKKETKSQPKPKKKEHQKYATVAVAQGDGVIDAFNGVEVDEIVNGQQTMNPSAEDFLNAFDRIDAENIFVLPNNSNIILAAEQARDMYKESHPEVNVVVIKTKSVGAGYVAASLLEFKGESVDQMVEEVNDYIKEVYSIEVTTATRDTNISGVEVKQGHYIGILNHTLVADNENKLNCLLDSVSKVESIGMREMALIFFGNNMPKAEQEKTTKELQAKYPSLNITAIDGGQDVYDYIVAIS